MIEAKTTIDIKRTGMKLREHALHHGYSVKDIQHYLGLSCPQPVYRWYKGIILPSIDNLLKLSELFQVHMEELLVIEHGRMNYILERSNPTSFNERMTAYYKRMAS